MSSGGKYWVIAAILFLSLVSVPVCAMVPAWNITTNGALLTDIAISDDGSRVVIGSASGNATVYDHNGTVVWETRVPGSLLVGCEGNGTAYLLVSREDPYKNKGSARFYNPSGSLVSILHTGWVEGVDTGPDRFLFGTYSGDLIVVNRSGAEIARFNDLPKTHPVAGLSLSADGKVFAYSLIERYPQVRYVTIASKSKRVFSKYSQLDIASSGADEPIGMVAVSGDGGWVVTAGGEGSHGLLCLYAKNGTRTWCKDMDTIKDIAITSNGSSIFAGTAKGDIVAFTRPGNVSWTYPSGSPITSLSFVDKRTLLAAGTAGGDLSLFNESGDLLWQTRIDGFPAGTVSRVLVSRNGNALAALVNDRDIHYFVQEPEPAVAIPVVNGTLAENSGQEVKAAEVNGTTAEKLGQEVGTAEVNGTLAEDLVSDSPASPSPGFSGWIPLAVWDGTKPLREALRVISRFSGGMA
jgi:hypothetical protein